MPDMFEKEESASALIGYGPKTLRRLNVTQRLEQKKSDLEKELEAVNTALDALKKDPNLEAAINAVQQAL